VGALRNLNQHDYPTDLGFPANVAGLSRQDLNYTNNAGYSLTVTNLPWGSAPYSVERYGLDQNTPLKLPMYNRLAPHILRMALPPPIVELIVLHATARN
jgi:hypothetical protein